MSIPEFKLDAFEGPLDLLLHLIQKHKLNIYDIEISLLLDQYLEYIEGLEEQDFDSAGDFLAMAARLVYIKTCSLLPQPEEAEEMKKELQGELLDYSDCKAAAARLLRLSVYGEVFVRPPEKLPVNKVFTGRIDPQRLVDAYLGMNAKTRSLKPIRAEQFTPLVRSRFVTVTSKIIHVLKRLLRSGECTIAELYVGVTDRSSRVATFLAVLELAKSGRIRLNDDNTVISFNRNAPRRHAPENKVNIVTSVRKSEYVKPLVTVERTVNKAEYVKPLVAVERTVNKAEYIKPYVTIEQIVNKLEYVKPVVTVEEIVNKQEYVKPSVAVEAVVNKLEYSAPVVTIEQTLNKSEYIKPRLVITETLAKRGYLQPEIYIKQVTNEQENSSGNVTIEQVPVKEVYLAPNVTVGTVAEVTPYIVREEEHTDITPVVNILQSTVPETEEKAVVPAPVIERRFDDLTFGEQETEVRMADGQGSAEVHILQLADETPEGEHTINNRHETAKTAALDAVGIVHTKAIPAFLLLTDSTPERTEKINNNRFGMRFFWGYPAKGSCWSYRRVRL